jgi:plasmid stabilization system protein ParE
MRLEIVEPALDEVANAIQHYRAISVSLAADFASEFNRSLALITSQPRAWARTGSQRAELRKRVMARFPYAVIYRVESDCVRVFAVMHHSRRPGYWRSRL